MLKMYYECRFYGNNMFLPSGGGGGGARRGGRPGTVDINGQLLVLFNTYSICHMYCVLLCIEDFCNMELF